MPRFARNKRTSRQPGTAAPGLAAGSFRRGKIESLEALRAVAALLVVFYHLQDIFVRKAGLVPLGGLFAAGDRGVDIFFVLSGFIIAWTHGEDIGNATRLPRYLYRRACRIYPSVWILSLAALGVYLYGFGGQSKAWKLDTWNIIASMALLPQFEPSLVNVTWTLTYEVFFYVLFAALILNRAGALLLFAWQAAIAFTAAGVLRSSAPLFAYYLRPICLEFGIGMACAYLLGRLSRFDRSALLPHGTLAVLGASTIAMGLLWEAFRAPHGLEHVRYLVYGGGSAALILGLAAREQCGLLRVPRVAAWLGGASYAIYLVHFSFITLAATAVLRWHILPVSNFVMLACATLAIAAGAGFHRFVDQPIQTMLRDFGRRLFQPPQFVPGVRSRPPLAAGNGVRSQW